MSLNIAEMISDKNCHFALVLAFIPVAVPTHMPVIPESAVLFIDDYN